MNSSEVLEMIRAGYSKAEIEAFAMEDNLTNSNNNVMTKGNDESDPVQVKSVETGSDEVINAEKNAKVTDNSETNTSESVSNLAVLAAINNLTKVIQESNRNNTTTEGDGADAPKQSAVDVMSKMFK